VKIIIDVEKLSTGYFATSKQLEAFYGARESLPELIRAMPELIKDYFANYGWFIPGIEMPTWELEDIDLEIRLPEEITQHQLYQTRC
jgi:hypothetical protein